MQYLWTCVLIMLFPKLRHLNSLQCNNVKMCTSEGKWTQMHLVTFSTQKIWRALYYIDTKLMFLKKMTIYKKFPLDNLYESKTLLLSCVRNSNSQPDGHFTYRFNWPWMCSHILYFLYILVTFKYWREL